MNIKNIIYQISQPIIEKFPEMAESIGKLGYDADFQKMLGNASI